MKSFKGVSPHPLMNSFSRTKTKSLYLPTKEKNPNNNPTHHVIPLARKRFSQVQFNSNSQFNPKNSLTNYPSKINSPSFGIRNSSQSHSNFQNKLKNHHQVQNNMNQNNQNKNYENQMKSKSLQYLQKQEFIPRINKPKGGYNSIGNNGMKGFSSNHQLKSSFNKNPHNQVIF